MEESYQLSMQSLCVDKMSDEQRTKLESYIKTLEDQSKPVPNDDRQERYCKYITTFASHFGNERVILTGSTIKGLRLRSHKDEGDFDYLIISGITIPEDALEQREDLPCFVHIRTDEPKTYFSESLIVDGKYLHSKVLKEFEDTKEGFPITSGLKPILTAPKISKGRHSKYLEVNLKAKPGTSQVHYFIKKSEAFNSENLSVIDEEDDAGYFQSAVQSSPLSTNMQDLLCNLVRMLEKAPPMDNNYSLLFQSIGSMIKSLTSSESSMPSAKRICRRESNTGSGSEKVHHIQYLYKRSKDFIAAFTLQGKLPCLDKWKQRMENRKNLHWPKPDTIDEIYNAEMYLVAKLAIVDPNPSIDFCLGF
uniref:Mab-21-like nucleotidyltransferase domain-containing protein n=1 Tax=Magallana gigas TaxID=29159 RepID=A0A8W8N1G6_MAGGI